MKTGPVLSITGWPPQLRQGTATAAAWNALIAMEGHPRQTVLIALGIAERSWHAGGNRTVQGINPPGWLRRFKDHIEWVPSHDSESE